MAGGGRRRRPVLPASAAGCQDGAPDTGLQILFKSLIINQHIRHRTSPDRLELIWMDRSDCDCRAQLESTQSSLLITDWNWVQTSRWSMLFVNFARSHATRRLICRLFESFVWIYPRCCSLFQRRLWRCRGWWKSADLLRSQLIMQIKRRDDFYYFRMRITVEIGVRIHGLLLDLFQVNVNEIIGAVDAFRLASFFMLIDHLLNLDHSFDFYNDSLPTFQSAMIIRYNILWW